jgi:carboxymethylenebutenolidase
MAEWTTLRAQDGHAFAAWTSSRPEPMAGLVVVQEIFGVNEHIREVADRYAALGFAAVAPALFDRAEKGVEPGYTEADVAKGRELRGRFSWDLSLLDLAAAAESVRHAGKVGVIGYCWGGSMAWRLAASESSRETYKSGKESLVRPPIGGTAKLPVDAAVCYYGAQIVDYLHEKPKCPTLLIFGDEDTSIPSEAIVKIRARLSRGRGRNLSRPARLRLRGARGVPSRKRASRFRSLVRISRPAPTPVRLVNRTGTRK